MGGSRKLIVQPPHKFVHPARKVHVDIEGLIRTVIAVGRRLMLVFIAAEEVNAVLDDRATERSAQLLIRIREHALSYKIRGIKLVIAEISRERARENIGSRLCDRIHEHSCGAPLARVESV